MSQTFDPYQQWLGIPVAEQPPNHYRLLGLRVRETDPARILQAAEQRIQIVRALAGAERAELGELLAAKIATARATLLNPALKQHYDAILARQTAPAPTMPTIQISPAGNGRAEQPRRKSSLSILLAAGAGVATVAVVAVALLRPTDALPPLPVGQPAAPSDSSPVSDAPPSPDAHPAPEHASRIAAHRAIRGPRTMADLMAADTPADNGSLTSELAIARQAMAGRNLDAARHHLDAVRDSARSPTERAELRRVERFLGLLETFWSAVTENGERLEAGDEIALADGPAIVVEKRDEKLTLRIAGQNRRYAMSDLPRPVVLALAARSLGTSGPRSNLALGVFHAADARGDRAEARRLLQDAGDEGRALLAEIDLMPPGGQPDAEPL